ncbi:MAG: hypothetical protein J6Y78_10875 [Paludibacteraceae bacterium]|nr:hypothetical protein [Paludibacteraceae bacterium]
MNFSRFLYYSLEVQGIDLELKEVPFNVFLKNGDILTLCFLELEDEDALVVAETNNMGAEEIRIIPKENIEYISIYYDFEENDGNDEFDRMII